MKIMGIDAGLQGALAWVDGLKSGVFDMPVEKKIDSQNVVAYHSVFEYINNEMPQMIVLEQQQVQAVTSKRSSFIIGRNYQALLLAINHYANIYGVSVVLVRPAEWKKTLGLIAPKGSSSATKKKITAQFVETVFPKAEIYTPRCRLMDGRSDALAIAEYGRRKYQ